MNAERTAADTWPKIDYRAWKETELTLHLWSQIVGKVRLVQTPWINHSWHVPLYVTARGLTTSPIPHGNRIFEINFDFIGHSLEILEGSGQHRTIGLQPMSVADFYRAVMASLDELGLPVEINKVPSEMVDPLPFDEDQEHASYDADAANRFWRALAQVHRVFQRFRSEFIGKCSPVHFFWGSFDLAVTRFSGRPAPPHPGGIPNMPDWVAREAYSHEVSSAGFWPGGELLPSPIFYSYAYPEPEGFREQEVRPDAASFNRDLGEFVLPYDEVRGAESPDDALLEFLHTTYWAAADLGGWDREAFALKLPA
jgi:hypothetical protein